MSTRYPGGFINRSAPVIVGPTNGEGGSAPGVWTLEQASYYTKQGTWPLPIKQGGLWSWGEGLTYGATGQDSTINTSSPVQVGSSTNWRVLSSGTANSAAIKSDGTLWVWGRNNFGQLGIGNTLNKSSPVQVGSLTTWSKVAVSAQNYFCGAIKTDGTLWGWGWNAYGSLGLNDVANRSSPVQIASGSLWSDLSLGNGVFSAIKTTGTLWGWGFNYAGGLGDGTTVHRSSPVQVGALTTWLSVSAGSYNALAIKTDGTLWSWGNNSYGELGIGTTANKSSPVQIGSLTDWSKSSLRRESGIAIKTNGTLWTWGEGDQGELGQGNAINTSSPIQVGSDTTWLLPFASSYKNFAAIKTDGTLWVCGNNFSGQLGQNNLIYRSSPVQVGSATTWKSIAFGTRFVLGVLG